MFETKSLILKSWSDSRAVAKLVSHSYHWFVVRAAWFCLSFHNVLLAASNGTLCSNFLQRDAKGKLHSSYFLWLKDKSDPKIINFRVFLGGVPTFILNKYLEIEPQIVDKWHARSSCELKSELRRRRENHGKGNYRIRNESGEINLIYSVCIWGTSCLLLLS